MSKSTRQPTEYPKPIPVDERRIARVVGEMTFDQAVARFGQLSALVALTDAEVYERKMLILKDRRIANERCRQLLQINEWRPGLIFDEITQLRWLWIHLDLPKSAWERFRLPEPDLGWQAI